MAWNTLSTWNNIGSGSTIPAGWVQTVFTVDWASLDPDSPFTNAAFSAIVAGDSCIYDETSAPDGFTVSMSGDGVFTITGIDADQEFDYFIYDVSDGTSGTTDTIAVTYVPSNASVIVNQATETDIAQPVTVSSSNVIAVGLASSTEIAQSIGVDIGVQSVPVGLVTEADSAQSIAPVLGAINVPIGQATENDIAQSLSLQVVGLNILVNQAAEINTVFSLSVFQRVNVPIGQAIETDLAQPINIGLGSVSLLLGLVTEIDTAFPVLNITPLYKTTYGTVVMTTSILGNVNMLSAISGSVRLQ